MGTRPLAIRLQGNGADTLVEQEPKGERMNEEHGWIDCDSPIGDVVGWDTYWRWREDTAEYRVDAISEKRYGGNKYGVWNTHISRSFIESAAIGVGEYLAHQWNERAENAPLPGEAKP